MLNFLKSNALLVAIIGAVTAVLGIVATVLFISNLSAPEQVGQNTDNKTPSSNSAPKDLTPETPEPTPDPDPSPSTTPTPTTTGTTTTTPSPTPSDPVPETPDTPPPASVSCALPKYPNPACTGVPAGTTLTTISGDYTANTPGEVVNAKRITGNLYIGAEGIVVTNSQIDGTIYNNQALDHFSFTVTDTTIGPETGCIGQPGINDSRYTARRVEVRGHDDGFRVGTPGDVAIYDSYAKLCFLSPDVAPPDGSHSDGVQAYCPTGICSGLIVDHNTFDSRGITATFMLNLAYEELRNVTATNNMLGGGPYVLVAKWFDGPNYEIHDNRIIDNSWVYAPVSGEGTCAHQTWSGNTIVTVDDNYAITSTVRTQDCQY